MDWLTLALSAALVWAVGNVFSKKGLEHFPALWNNITFNILGLFLWIPLALILANFQIQPLSLIVFLAMLIASGTYYFYFYALGKGELALTGTILATYPVTTVILSTLILKEQISIIQIGGIGFIILGGILIALPEKGLPENIRNLSWLKWGLVAATLIGFGDFLMKFAVNSIGSISQIFYLPLISIPLSVANYYFDKKSRKIPRLGIKQFLPVLVGIPLLSIGNIFFFLAYQDGQASLVAPISSVYPALMVLLAVIFLKEKITKKQLIGIVGTIVGIILLGINF